MEEEDGGRYFILGKLKHLVAGFRRFKFLRN